ncbi:MobF family relaxase [Halomonas casei]|uniref:MobF family relaxase n=1 Tax=Halomonas casei TaxID=2742613 RepID=UPI003CEA3A1F
MLSHQVLTRQHIGRTASYYEDGADDYYAKEGEASQWQGEGAKALGLEGAVDSQRFRELLAGKVENGTHIMRSSTRDDAKARIGVDLTFSAPKSVSMQALIHGDARIIQAHDRAVSKAVEHAEQRAQARQKVAGKSHVESTNNLVVAKFRHETSRERDPQLHTHAIVLNMTQRSDGQWRALRNDEIIKSTKYLGAVYRSELAHELQGMGYQLRHDKDGMFELGHISREQVEKFSARSDQIEKILEEKGLTRATASASEKQVATMQSRAPKRNTEREVIFNEWQTRAGDLKIDFESKAWAGAGASTDTKKNALEISHEEAAKRALRYSLNHLTERQAVVNHTELMNTAMKKGMGQVRQEDLAKELASQVKKGGLIKEDPLYAPASGNQNDPELARPKNHWVDEVEKLGLPRQEAVKRVADGIRSGRLVKQETRYTTQAALEREKRILTIEREGRGVMPPVMSQEAAAKRLESASLNKGQRSAAALMLSTENRITAVQGLAGTGKSHMLDTARKEIESQGYEVMAFAPYGSQVKALREMNVKAKTLASFLRAKDKEINDKTVIVLDEAGVVPTRQMEQLMKLVEKSGSRMVMLGDTEQTKAIEAGRPFDQLQKEGMQTARMDEIMRQKSPELKKAVELAAGGKAGESLGHVSNIYEIKEDTSSWEKLAHDFISLSPQDRDNTIIVSGTNEARRHINKTIRQGLETEGKGSHYDVLLRKDTTQAERRFSQNYQVGDIIQPEKDYESRGLMRGQNYTVLDNGPGNQLTVEGAEGKTIKFSPSQVRKISVYEHERNEFSPGDRVRITRNDAKLDLANGDRFSVVSSQNDELKLKNDEGREVTLSGEKALHLDYAYATTVHSSQGLTADRVLVDAQTNSRVTARDVHYVAISRARFEASIYTNSSAKLAKAVERENGKNAALDIQNAKLHRGIERPAQAEIQPAERARNERTGPRDIQHEAGR